MVINLKKQFCEYCGINLNERCECLRQLAEERMHMVEEYENSPEIHLGWTKQDIIDSYRRER